MNEPTPAAPSQPAPIPSALTPTAPASLPPGAHRAELSATEAETMAGWIKADLASGKLMPEQAAKAFDDMGTPHESRGPDIRSEEAKELDKHFPTAKASEYTIRYADPGQEPQPMTPQLQAFDATARGWMADAGLPREVGNSLVNAIAKVAQHTKAMTPAQLDTYGYAEFAKREQVYGAALDDKLRAAGRMVEALDAKQPGLKNLLRSNGIGDSARVSSLLIQHAEIFHARRTGR